CQKQVRARKWGKGGDHRALAIATADKDQDENDRIVVVLKPTPSPRRRPRGLVFMAADACGPACGRLHGTLSPAPALILFDFWQTGACTDRYKLGWERDPI